MKNKYPIFIPTKGRWDNPITINMFNRHAVDFNIVVEPQEYDKYSSIVSKDKIIVTPHKNEGLTVTRNFIWDYAESLGVEKFWTFDDNIGRVYRWNNNRRIQVIDGTYLKVIEDFSDRYQNLNLIGMNYRSFCKSRDKIPAFYINTRIYSNMLITTNTFLSDGKKLRNRLFYNDDTDLCLQVLKDGLPIIEVNAFLIDKATTMTVKGGMTDYYNSEECQGRYKFAEELYNAHPDVTTITKKFNRWHHHVNYAPFKRNRLIKKIGVVVPDRVNNYGMILQQTPLPPAPC